MLNDCGRRREDQSGAVAKDGLLTTENARAGSGLPAPNYLAERGRWHSIIGCRCILHCLRLSLSQITVGPYITVNNTTDLSSPINMAVGSAQCGVRVNPIGEKVHGSRAFGCRPLPPRKRLGVCVDTHHVGTDLCRLNSTPSLSLTPPLVNIGGRDGWHGGFHRFRIRGLLWP